MEYPVEDLQEATIDRQRGYKKAQAEHWLTHANTVKPDHYSHKIKQTPL